uniref:Uncharacterized protein n=1 Tax=Chromera velia CCMP2878 TaxID=1169474 RepID=A0A0G4G940_9ALVE|eukprot:Cvel_4346.t1-p1 / transcript=Cvel_4346.t1 / gene=Cvel_4346 / organism=Chromera_velia_CCMP2878 / gene_product=hypothetical protein / transcript_product=hypothetical protein / location=Cvel_scaffold188:68576-79740(-) / protein_length=1712 / sequence_SO=supercontig / SO=protein_coding / is_pseudo=false
MTVADTEAVRRCAEPGVQCVCFATEEVGCASVWTGGLGRAFLSQAVELAKEKFEILILGLTMDRHDFPFGTDLDPACTIPGAPALLKGRVVPIFADRPEWVGFHSTKPAMALLDWVLAHPGVCSLIHTHDYRGTGFYLGAAKKAGLLTSPQRNLEEKGQAQTAPPPHLNLQVHCCLFFIHREMWHVAHAYELAWMAQERLAFASADSVVALSPSNLKGLPPTWTMPGDRSFIPNVVHKLPQDLAEVVASRSRRGGDGAQGGEEREADAGTERVKLREIIFYGKLNFGKGFFLFRDAILLLSQTEGVRFDGLKVTVVGPLQNNEPEIRREMKSLRAAVRSVGGEDVVLREKLNTRGVTELFVSAGPSAVVVLPSFTECMSFALYDVLQTDVDFVLSNIPAHKEALGLLREENLGEGGERNASLPLSSSASPPVSWRDSVEPPLRFFSLQKESLADLLAERMKKGALLRAPLSSSPALPSHPSSQQSPPDSAATHSTEQQLHQTAEAEGGTSAAAVPELGEVVRLWKAWHLQRMGKRPEDETGGKAVERNVTHFTVAVLFCRQTDITRLPDAARSVTAAAQRMSEENARLQLPDISVRLLLLSLCPASVPCVKAETTACRAVSAESQSENMRSNLKGGEGSEPGSRFSGNLKFSCDCLAVSARADASSDVLFEARKLAFASLQADSELLTFLRASEEMDARALSMYRTAAERNPEVSALTSFLDMEVDTKGDEGGRIERRLFLGPAPELFPFVNALGGFNGCYRREAVSLFSEKSALGCDEWEAHAAAALRGQLALVPARGAVERAVGDGRQESSVQVEGLFPFRREEKDRCYVRGNWSSCTLPSFCSFIMKGGGRAVGVAMKKRVSMLTPKRKALSKMQSAGLGADSLSEPSERESEKNGGRYVPMSIALGESRGIRGMHKEKRHSSIFNVGFYFSLEEFNSLSLPEREYWLDEWVGLVNRQLTILLFLVVAASAVVSLSSLIIDWIHAVSWNYLSLFPDSSENGFFEDAVEHLRRPGNYSSPQSVASGDNLGGGADSLNPYKVQKALREFGPDGDREEEEGEGGEEEDEAAQHRLGSAGSIEGVPLVPDSDTALPSPNARVPSQRSPFSAETLSRVSPSSAQRRQSPPSTGTERDKRGSAGSHGVDSVALDRVCSWALPLNAGGEGGGQEVKGVLREMTSHHPADAEEPQGRGGRRGRPDMTRAEEHGRSAPSCSSLPVSSVLSFSEMAESAERGEVRIESKKVFETGIEKQIFKKQNREHGGGFEEGGNELEVEEVLFQTRYSEESNGSVSLPRTSCRKLREESLQQNSLHSSPFSETPDRRSDNSSSRPAATDSEVSRQESPSSLRSMQEELSSQTEEEEEEGGEGGEGFQSIRPPYLSEYPQWRPDWVLATRGGRNRTQTPSAEERQAGGFSVRVIGPSCSGSGDSGPSPGPSSRVDLGGPPHASSSSSSSRLHENPSHTAGRQRGGVAEANEGTSPSRRRMQKPQRALPRVAPLGQRVRDRAVRTRGGMRTLTTREKLLMALKRFTWQGGGTSPSEEMEASSGRNEIDKKGVSILSVGPRGSGGRREGRFVSPTDLPDRFDNPHLTSSHIAGASVRSGDAQRSDRERSGDGRAVESGGGVRQREGREPDVSDFPRTEQGSGEIIIEIPQEPNSSSADRAEDPDETRGVSRPRSPLSRLLLGAGKKQGRGPGSSGVGLNHSGRAAGDSV